MENIPLEIMGIIMAYLGHNDILSCRLVANRWLILASRQIKAIKITMGHQGIHSKAKSPLVYKKLYSSIEHISYCPVWLNGHRLINIRAMIGDVRPKSIKFCSNGAKKNPNDKFMAEFMKLNKCILEEVTSVTIEWPIGADRGHRGAQLLAMYFPKLTDIYLVSIPLLKVVVDGYVRQLDLIPKVNVHGIEYVANGGYYSLVCEKGITISIYFRLN
jgi:F-box domain